MYTEEDQELLNHKNKLKSLTTFSHKIKQQNIGKFARNKIQRQITEVSRKSDIEDEFEESGKNHNK